MFLIILYQNWIWVICNYTIGYITNIQSDFLFKSYSISLTNRNKINKNKKES